MNKIILMDKKNNTIKYTNYPLFTLELLFILKF